ncbi:MAG: Alkaline phosphatase synthesis transcriptional regulatory protein PhoP [candidate division BRC1 bacterium ADurb.BinA292]|nr:MAG: Alkaline phosphatase synthesis transcriptional regulatory protein PhoP [candidate division BRC1 bacterium ADurb.BinA292]
MSALRVLILEDDQDIIDLIQSVLEPDFECYSAPNGDIGLDAAIHGEPDLIICDIMMPVMDGREFLRRLRLVPGLESIPVIILSALTSRDHIRDGYALGAALYVPKPIEPKRFRRNLEMFVVDHELKVRPKRMSLAELRHKTFKASATPPPPRRQQAAFLMPDLTHTSTPIEFTSEGLLRNPHPPRDPERGASQPTAKTFSSLRPSAPARPPLRAAASGSPAGGDPSARSDKGGARSVVGQKIRMMIIEDDMDTCQLLKAEFERDHDVLIANDGVAGVEQAVKYKPDIFVIDGILPRLNGFQVTTMLRKHRDFFRSPIILISGKATPRDRQHAERLGVTHFIAKPFTGAQMRRLVEETEQRSDFSVHKDRVDMKVIRLEKLQHLETHRTQRNFRADAVENSY